MISAESAIRTLRRDLTITSILKATVLGTGIAATLLVPAGGAVMLVLVAFFVGFTVLSVRNARSSSLAAGSPSLIARGEFDEAEQRIEQVLGTFWLFRPVKLMGLHHLAVLRHAQRRWRESALLSRALLGQRLTGMSGVARTSQMMLADSLLELGDLRGAHEALLALYEQRLTLIEAMNLLVVQLDYESRIGAWANMFHSVGYKVQLAELMPSPAAARAQAMLALAAVHVGRADWAEWLAGRAELLADAHELIAQRPILKNVFGTRTRSSGKDA